MKLTQALAKQIQMLGLCAFEMISGLGQTGTTFCINVIQYRPLSKIP